jgi:hypothetical protein
MPLEDVIANLRRSAPHALDARCVEALVESTIESEPTATNLTDEPALVGGYIN